MNPIHYVVLGSAAAAVLGLAFFALRGDDDSRPPAPVYGVKLPAGYQDWPLIAPAQEAAPLDELRVVVGNEVAMRAYRHDIRPFPDGTVLVKRAWKHVPSPDFTPASIPATPPPCR
jgi:hypothetical protein